MSAGTGPGRTYTLLGPDGRPYRSSVPGTRGGYRRGRLYGRLDCPSALRALARGHYRTHRVFFADEATAVAAGYRPCAVCLPTAYARWKARQESAGPHAADSARSETFPPAAARRAAGGLAAALLPQPAFPP
ncbi:Ada metal-binding domain-containing protein [Streptomyces sp. TS71-3]|uniref:Ada metal-binding domain-containing protein n=1 Tax=Streptomyces sp. TS71-3 TaxID=2733862 RepID=UPI001B0B9B5A|nr:Ada metal-binding domain-containing protein [Streptomyces sp. TS71-3]GHJ35518.1 hypothetical protein Sm713_11270 [Streptomyces sp. TS71-3]